jgi:hypothetical protein
VLVALVAIASAAFPYVSQRYSALAAGASDLDSMTSRAQTAAMLDPTSLEPFQARANAHLATASAALNDTVRLQQLRLAATAWQEALEIEPDSWICHYQAAGVLFAASDVALASDWASAQELEKQARIHLTEANTLNPLSPEIGALKATRPW